MANFVCLMAARAAKAGWDVREHGVAGESGRRLRVYASAETHTWIQKATDLGGLGTDRDPVDPDRCQTAHGRRRVAPADRRGRRRRRCAVPRRRNGRVGQHGCRRSAAGDHRGLQGSTVCGFTSMAPTAALRRHFPMRPMICTG